MEQQLIQHLKSEILKTSLNPKKVIKLPAKMEGIESQDIEALSRIAEMSSGKQTIRRWAKTSPL